MSYTPAPLNPLADPLALARLQVLLIPVHHPGSEVSSEGELHPLTEEIFEQWSKLFRRIQTLRGDEITYGKQPSTPGHRRGSAVDPNSPRSRFLPTSAGGSISRTANANHVHLAYPTQPPAKHLYPLSLLRMTAFPLVVIGVAVDDTPPEAYAVPGKKEKKEKGKKTKKGLSEREWSQTFVQSMSTFLPPTAAFPLVKRLVVVPAQSPIPGSGQRSPTGSSFNGSPSRQLDSGEVRRAPLEGADGWVAKLLGEVVGEVFGELGELAASLESPAGLKTLSGTLLPSLSATLPHMSPVASPTPGADQLRIVTGSPAPTAKSTPGLSHSTSLSAVPEAGLGQPLSRALTPGGRPTSVQAPSAPPIQSTTIAQVTTPTSTASSNPFRRSAALIGRSTSGAGPSPGIAAALMNTGAGKYTSATLTGIAGGRLLKLLGDMFLITGMYSDAIKCYDDGAERCRAVGDVLWEALAREGRAVAGIGEAWEGRDGSNLSTPFPTSPIPVEILSHYLSSLACLCRSPLPFPPAILSPAPQTPAIAGLTSSTPATAPISTAAGTGEGLLAYLYASLCLRISHFVLLIYAAGGWGSIALSSLIFHSLPRSFPPLKDASNEDTIQMRNRRATLVALAQQTQLTRASVLGHAEAALGPFRRAMTKAEQLSVLIEVIWIARWLEMERKEAAATREMVKLVGKVLVEGREETQRLTSRVDSAVSTTFGSGANQGIAIRRREMTEGNSGVIDLIDRVCKAFGIKLVSFDDKLSPTIIQSPKEIDEPRFGWPEMQVEVMKEAIAVVEALPDHPSVVRLSISALNALHSFLSPSNQNYLAKLYPQAMGTIRRRAIDFDGIPWWLPGRVVLSVEVASLPPARVPIEHARDEIMGQAQGRKDPFLYNPRFKAPEVGKTVLVANEQVDVFVTLQNPFTFDLEIQDLSLLTSGAPLVTTPLPLILPASSVQTVRVTGQAPSAGSLQIRGVNVRLMDGSSAEFLLPVVDGEEQKREHKHRTRVLAEAMKTKRHGLDARNRASLAPSDPVPPIPSEDNHRWLECSVVEEQPLLSIKKTSLSHGTIMLYNGERSTIRITLENSSQVPVDFIKLSFEDSVSREAHSLLSEGEVSPEKAYELDQESIQRPVFTWDNSSELSIPAGGRQVINVQCLGKVGCTDAVIRIDYGYINRAEGSTEAFHTRQLTFPVLFTVYQTLEPYALDLVSLRPSTESRSEAKRLANGTRPRSSTFSKSTDEELRSVLIKDDDQNVLFCINVRNVFSVPFEVALASKAPPDDKGGSLKVTRLVPPGATERLVLPIKRQALTHEERSRPIPQPSGRQYVVEKAKKSQEEQMRLRELFWFRDRLLSMVSVSWREPGSLRSGHLSLSDQQLLPTQLDSFRLDEVSVTLAIESRGQASLSATDFIDLVITISNNLERELRPYVRLEALPTSSTGSSWSMPGPPPAPKRLSSLPATPMPVPKTVAFDGVLATTLSTLAPGESATHTIGAVLLASGSYSFRAAAEEVVDITPTSPPSVCFSPPVTIDVA